MLFFNSAVRLCKETSLPKASTSTNSPLNTCHLLSILSRLYTTVTVKCCTLLSPVTIAIFTGPSLSSERVTKDPSATRDSERYLGDGLGRESESSDSETEETSGRKEKNGALFNVDEWIALSASQEVVVVILKNFYFYFYLF